MKYNEIFEAIYGKKSLSYSEDTAKTMFAEWCEELEAEGLEVTEENVLQKVDEHYEAVLESGLLDEIDDIIYGDF